MSDRGSTVPVAVFSRGRGRAWRWIASPLALYVLPATVVLALGRVAPVVLDQATIVLLVAVGAGGVLAVMVTAVAATRGIVRSVRRARLLRDGVDVAGRVLEARVFAVGAPRVDDVVIAELAIAITDGIERRRVALRERLDVDTVPAVGEAVRVLIDPRRPEVMRLAPTTGRD